MKPRFATLLVLPALFFALVLAARAWFAIGAETPREHLRFEVQRELPGWTFVPETVGDQAQAILGTTNLFNGAFLAPDGRRVTVFAADWRAESSEAMSVVQHTPDICWVGVGMKAASLGQPQRITLQVGDRTAPFECRVFGPPQGMQRELVLWCTLVGGSVLPEPGRWAIEDADTGTGEGRDLRFWSSRRLATGHFLANVSQRRRGVGEKQFVRFSVPITDGWEEALERMKTFAPAWLQLRGILPKSA